MLKTQILYEDNEILIINKPEGVSVQGGKGIFHPLDEELSKELSYKIYLVHRLDKETSGLLIVAKNSAAAAKWTNLIGSKNVKKEYMALCANLPLVNGKRCASGVLDFEISTHKKIQSAKTFFKLEKEISVQIPPPATAIATDEKNAGSQEEKTPVTSGNPVTTVASVSSGTPVSPEKITLYLMRITLGTGRMHQIRIQMANAKAPLAADDKYGDFKLNKKLRRAGIKKLQLAAVKLTIPSQNGKTLSIECNLPPHMKNFL